MAVTQLSVNTPGDSSTGSFNTFVGYQRREQRYYGKQRHLPSGPT